MIASILGWTATILFTLCYIPQIAKMVRSRSVEGISPLFFGITFLANCIALVYAAMIHQGPLIFKYSFGILLSLLVLYFYYAETD